MTRILGVDPGVSGGWALLTSDARLVRCGVFPTSAIRKSRKTSTQLDGPTLAALFASLNADHAFVEAVSSRPRQAGQFQFGVNTGTVHGILHALRVPFTLVAPASWKATVGIKRGEDEAKAETKTRARLMAASLYPDHADKFSRVKDDGVAEATLIALHGIYHLATTNTETP